MSETSEKRTLVPHFLIIGVIILAIVFWPSEDESPVAPEPEVIQPELEVPEEPEVFETRPTPPPVELEEKDEVEP